MVYPRSVMPALTSDAKVDDIRCHPGSTGARSATAWARLAAQLVEFSEAQGVPRARLLAAGGLAEDALERHDSRIPMRALYDMMQAAAEATGDEHVGLHLVQSVSNGIEVLGFLLSTSATLGAALDALVRYQRVLSDDESYRLDRSDGVARLSLSRRGASHPAHRHIAELVAHELTAGSVRRFGRSIPGTHVEFRRAPPAQPEVYRQAFGEQLTFGAAADRITMPVEVLDLPLPGSNLEMRAYFERQLGIELDRLPSPTLIGRVQTWVARNLETSPGLPQVARALGMSSRTLQRRLRREGWTVREIVDDTRRERACGVLLATGTIAQTAQRLGYSEPSAFHRAFKRWTGQTPGERLAQHRSGASDRHGSG